MDKDNEVIISGIAAAVPMDNYEEFDQEIDPEKMGVKLVQENTLKGTSRRFQIYKNHYLFASLIEKKNKPEKKYSINLAWLTDRPEHNKIIVWKWLHLAILSGLTTGILIYLALEQMLKPEYTSIIAVITFTLTLIFSLIFVYCKRDEYIFKSYFSDTSIFVVENKKPDPQAFNAFHLKMLKIINKTQAALSVADRLVGELKMCRKLKDEGIIDEQAYTSARTVIFKHKEYKS